MSSALWQKSAKRWTQSHARRRVAGGLFCTAASATAKLRVPLAKERVIYCQQSEDVVWPLASVTAQQQQQQQRSVVERQRSGDDAGAQSAAYIAISSCARRLRSAS